MGLEFIPILVFPPTFAALVMAVLVLAAACGFVLWASDQQ